MSTDPNEESGSGWVPLIFAIVISMIIVSYAVIDARAVPWRDRGYARAVAVISAWVWISSLPCPRW